MKGQYSVEYLLIYAASMAIIGYLLSVFNVFSSMLSGAPASLGSPVLASCEITPEFNCYGMYLNTTTSNAVVEFSNDANMNLLFSQNSFAVRLGTSQQLYRGSCVAATTGSNYAPSGSKVICTASVKGATLFKDEKLTPVFSISYGVCQNSNTRTCGTAINTTGTAMIYVS